MMGYLLTFSQFCRKVEALDLDDKALNEAKDNFDHINFVHCDAFKYETNVKYDVIVMLDFIEHFTFEDGEKLIKKYAKMLSSKGVLIIGTPSKNFIKYRAEHNSAHHLHEYYPDELKSMLSYYFDRSMTFAMNDEIVHTGNIDLAWFIFEVCSYPKGN